MISELKDNEIFDFLMTSDLTDDYSPSELKYLIIKWRYFYRILHSNTERDILDLQGKVKDIEEKLVGKDNEIIQTQIKVADKENLINQMKSRKLTWKERIKGKIILKEDENKNIKPLYESSSTL